MIEHYTNLKGFFKGDLNRTLNFYLKTDGCYIVSSEDGVALAYRCFIDKPTHVNILGDDLYIHYVSGDISVLTRLCSDHIDYVGYDHKGRFYKHKLSKLKAKIIKD